MWYILCRRTISMVRLVKHVYGATFMQLVFDRVVLDIPKTCQLKRGCGISPGGEFSLYDKAYYNTNYQKHPMGLIASINLFRKAAQGSLEGS